MKHKRYYDVKNITLDNLYLDHIPKTFGRVRLGKVRHGDIIDINHTCVTRRYMRAYGMVGMSICDLKADVYRRRKPLCR